MSAISSGNLTLAQFNLLVGNANGIRTPMASNLIGSITGSQAQAIVTMTIAAPCVVTLTGHGFSTGQQCYLQTTGALPTGLAANTTYFISVIDANTFNLATTLGNVPIGTKITTTGSQSGVHTIYTGGLVVQPNGFPGDLNSVVIPAGYQWEFGSLASTGSVAVVANTVTNICNQTLQAGKYLTWGLAKVDTSAIVAGTFVSAAISTSTTTNDSNVYVTQIPLAVTTSVGTAITTPLRRFSSSSTINLNLNGNVGASSITATFDAVSTLFWIRYF